MLGGLSLAPLGALFYFQLLLALAWKWNSRYVHWCILGAVLLHSLLSILLLRLGVLCAPCLVTAGCAVLVLAGYSWGNPSLLRQAAIVLSIGIVLAAPLILGSRTARLSAEGIRRTRAGAVARAFLGAEASAPAPPGRAQIVIYQRTGCGLCYLLRVTVLPSVKRQYGSVLDIRYLPAWRDLPTPIVVVRGRATTEFAGLPSVAELRSAVARALW